jgi:hypothetical protein
MLGSSKTGFATDSRDAGLYRRYAAGLCRQALLTRADPALPQQVACHVIVNERALAAMAERGKDDRAPRGPAALWHAVMRQVRKPAAGR